MDSELKELLSIVMSVVAVLISAFSLYHSLAQPQLNLSYYVYGVEQKYYNGAGKLVFNEWMDKEQQGYHEPDLKGDKQVDYCRPGSEVGFSIVNRGRIVAKNPTIVFQFHGIEITESLDKQLEEVFFPVNKSNHVHGGGYYSRYQWQPKESESLYINIEKIFPLISFSGCTISEGAYIEVFIAADQAKTKKFRIPVKVENLY